ncbi:hypothetical protein OH687_20180 [Burkholderia anthina]|nr:hypothetical protein OH687_20180 [Burkholderia anthina]
MHSLSLKIEVDPTGELHAALAHTDHQHTIASTRSVRCLTR